MNELKKMLEKVMHNQEEIQDKTEDLELPYAPSMMQKELENL